MYDNKEIKINPDGILNELNEYIELEKNFTINDLINFIKNNNKLSEIYNWIPPLINEYDINEKLNDEIFRLDIKRVIVDHKHNSFHSVEVTCKSKENIKETFSCSFLNLDQVRNINIKLCKGEIHYKNNKISKITNSLNLFEFITSIFSEFSFYGTKDNKKDMFNNLKEQLKEIQDNPESLKKWKNINFKK
jgi:hypothetical protein